MRRLCWRPKAFSSAEETQWKCSASSVAWQLSTKSLMDTLFNPSRENLRLTKSSLTFALGLLMLLTTGTLMELRVVRREKLTQNRITSVTSCSRHIALARLCESVVRTTTKVSGKYIYIYMCKLTVAHARKRNSLSNLDKVSQGGRYLRLITYANSGDDLLRILGVAGSQILPFLLTV